MNVKWTFKQWKTMWHCGKILTCILLLQLSIVDTEIRLSINTGFEQRGNWNYYYFLIFKHLSKFNSLSCGVELLEIDVDFSTAKLVHVEFWRRSFRSFTKVLCTFRMQTSLLTLKSSLACSNFGVYFLTGESVWVVKE